MNRILIRLAVILAAAASCEGAQRLDGCGATPSPDGWVHAPSVETLDRNLERAGYTFTRDSLLSALHDPRPDVRSLAAGKLGRDGETGSIMALVEALRVEKDTCAQGTMELELGMLGGSLLRASRQHLGGQVRVTPFQACTPSEPPVLALTIEQVPRPAYVTLGPVVRVTVRNVSAHVLPFFQTRSPAELLSTSVMNQAGTRARIPPEWGYLYRPLAELSPVKASDTNGIVLTGVLGTTSPLGLALEPNGEVKAC